MKGKKGYSRPRRATTSFTRRYCRTLSCSFRVGSSEKVTLFFTLLGFFLGDCGEDEEESFAFSLDACKVSEALALGEDTSFCLVSILRLVFVRISKRLSKSLILGTHRKRSSLLHAFPSLLCCQVKTVLSFLAPRCHYPSSLGAHCVSALSAAGRTAVFTTWN